MFPITPIPQARDAGVEPTTTLLPIVKRRSRSYHDRVCNLYSLPRNKVRSHTSSGTTDGIEPTPLAHRECASTTLNRHFSPTFPRSWIESIHQRCCSLGTASIRRPDVWTRQGSNLQPTPCKGVALPIELPAQSPTESPPPLSAIFRSIYPDYPDI